MKLTHRTLSWSRKFAKSTEMLSQDSARKNPLKTTNDDHRQDFYRNLLGYKSVIFSELIPYHFNLSEKSFHAQFFFFKSFDSTILEIVENIDYIFSISYLLYCVFFIINIVSVVCQSTCQLDSVFVFSVTFFLHIAARNCFQGDKFDLDYLRISRCRNKQLEPVICTNP